ncbi:MAG: hypothetical protein ACE5OQ_09165 [Woeseia sp.]
MKEPDNKRRYFGLLALFGASGTLIWCALPIVLVTLGMGSAVVALTSTVPGLNFVSQNKVLVFSFSALLLIFSGRVTFRQARDCPADPETLAAYIRAQRRNRRIFWTSSAIWLTGFFAAYLLLPLVRWLDGQP